VGKIHGSAQIQTDAFAGVHKISYTKFLPGSELRQRRSYHAVKIQRVQCRLFWMYMLTKIDFLEKNEEKERELILH
jgi:hypothetical protein